MSEEQTYREIPLTQGQVTLVDASKYEELTQWKWAADWNISTQRFYAARVTSSANGRRPLKIRMHRQVLGLGYSDGRDVDHINKDTLDNRMSNLRIATRAENMRNRGKNANNTSGYKGVSFRKEMAKWRSFIGVNGKKIHLGYFFTAEAAYKAYCAAAESLHGEFARLV